MTDGSRSSPAAIAVYSRPSARPREISSRSDNINIFRTAGILSRRTPHDQVLRLPDPKPNCSPMLQVIWTAVDRGRRLRQTGAVPVFADRGPSTPEAVTRFNE